MKLWPFKKKTEKTNVDAFNQQPILSPFQITFNSLGSVSVDWVHVVNKKQNDILLIDYFNQLSEVSAPIRKYSDASKLVKPYIVLDNGEIDTASKFNDVITRFWSNYSELLTIYKLLLGNVYVQGVSQAIVGNLTEKNLTELILLPSEYTTINLKQDQKIDFRSIEVKSYEVNFQNDSKYKVITITDPKKVLHLKTNNLFKDSSNQVYGISRLASAEKNLQAIASGYGARISLYDNGPRVILHGKNADNGFSSVNETEETDEIQKRINDNYGRTDGQYQVFVTKSALDATVISMNVRELQLNELNSADFRRICNVFNQDAKIHGDPQASTYDNMQTALTDFYINSFMPEMEGTFESLTKFLQGFGMKGEIKGDYSGIKEIAEFEKKQNDELFKQVERGLMTRNEYLEFIGESTVDLPEFDEYMTFYNGQWYKLRQDEQSGNNQELGGNNQSMQGQGIEETTQN